jgi:hypothetical protein
MNHAPTPSNSGPRRRRVGVAGVAAAAAALSGLLLLPHLVQALPKPPAATLSKTSTCTTRGTSSVGGGSYIVQSNEWNSTAAECLSRDGSPDFQVTSASIDNATDGAPGGYPSIYMGCHWGNCTAKQNGLPRQVSTFSSHSSSNPLTSVITTQPGGSSVYDVAYDIWFNQSSSSSGQPNAEELMLWLNHNGSVQPFGSRVATASIDGTGYAIWEGRQQSSGISWNTVSYVMQNPATSLSALNIGDLAEDSVSRGYMTSSDWLIDVEMGFELWAGGQGLAVDAFSVAPDGGSPPGGPMCFSPRPW